MNKVVVVHADWCGPCQSYKPIVAEAKSEIEAKGFEIEMVNADEQMDRCRNELGVRGVPATIIYKDGKIASTLVGKRTKEEILKEL
jgi:thioredoxin 1